MSPADRADPWLVALEAKDMSEWLKVHVASGSQNEYLQKFIFIFR